MKRTFLQAVQYHAWHRWKDAAWGFPAHEFERDSGMSGVSWNYTMPGDKPLNEIGFQIRTYDYWQRRPENFVLHAGFDDISYLFRMAAGRDLVNPQFHKQTLDEIIKLNPELRGVHYNSRDPQQVFDFLMGITSGFNPADINYYMNDFSRMDARTSCEAVAYKMALEKEVGASINWVPSPETILKIKGHYGLMAWHPPEDDITSYKTLLAKARGMPDLFNVQPDI